MEKQYQYNSVEEALEELRRGRIVLVTDDPDRENEGDMICAAEFATQENINFMACHAKGLICTPPCLATSGNTCPGLRRSCGFVPSSVRLRIVYPRSAAEIPVVVSTWSTDTVNAVEWLSVFSETICESPSRPASAALIGVQISPFAWHAIKLIFS